MTRMTSKIARFASDFAQNLSDFLQSQLDFSKITRFGCGSPTESIAFFVWPLKTPTKTRQTVFKYITMVTREKTLFKR
jgi:hypothetical protein